MSELDRKRKNAELRRKRVRARVKGTAERPRLSIKVSNLHITAQIIDDEKKHTVAYATTVGSKATGNKTDKATQIGSEIAKKAKKAGVTSIVFDRNSHKYAKRLNAFAEAARKEGLEF
jgi:ribosomal protein L18, bacterial type